MYNPLDIRWHVLNNIMSQYYLCYYQIFRLNGVPSEGTYQDSVTAPLGRELDDDAVGLEDDGDDDPEDPEVILQEVLSVIEKVSD